MAFDEKLSKKQEYECARRDEMAFRLRARTIRLVAERVRTMAANPEAIDPLEVAASTVTSTDAEILASLQQLVGVERLDGHRLNRLYEDARTDAKRALEGL